MNTENIIAGVGVGGMQDKYEVKILICYLLQNCAQPITREQLNFIFQNDKIVNYFVFCDAISDLLKSEHIFEKEHSDGKKYLYLNELGRTTSEKLKHSLPRSLKDNVVVSCMEMLAKMKSERENEVKITPCNNGFNVHCVIHDNDFDLLNLTVFAPDRLQAEYIKSKFKKDPTRIYAGLIDLLTSEEQ